jgi:hypothetical protein
LLEIDIVLQILLDVRSAREERPLDALGQHIDDCNLFVCMLPTAGRDHVR